MRKNEFYHLLYKPNLVIMKDLVECVWARLAAAILKVAAASRIRYFYPLIT
ncbi:hypothetical protein D1AOALGA4SA_1176 [Olavius algarvensis Delta 1 endosymbiont]|nr:hypothetical protein D1AOALGA4SA_1176 [Olavius algarvensis Delta 1 endosymbiont]